MKVVQTKQHQLLFLTNELQNPALQRSLHLPITFITFGLVKGRMYTHYGNKSVFILPNNSLQSWGNSVVYGGLFLCQDFNFYSTILDGYMICSLSTLRYNHVLDLQHRVNIDVTPITFSSLNDLSLLKYRELQPITAQTYLGNINHPKIYSRLHNKNHRRIHDGLDVANFKALYTEVICTQKTI